MDPIISTLSPPNPPMPVPLGPPMLDVENLVMSIRSIWKEDFTEHQGKVQDIIKGMQEVNDKINSIETRLTELETRSKVAEDVFSEQGSQIDRVTSVANEALSLVNGFESIMLENEQSNTAVFQNHTDRLNEMDARSLNDEQKFNNIETVNYKPVNG